MLIKELITRIDEIAWHEQVEREMSERPAVSSPPSLHIIEEELRMLAQSVDSVLLDKLEKEDGYLVWALRLAPFVEPANAKKRAGPYLDNKNWRVRYWAEAIMLVKD